MGTEKTPPPVRADTLNSGKCDVFSKINSRLGNFDRCQKKREEGGRRGQARPLPEHQHFSHSLISSFLLPSFLPAYSSCSCPLPYYLYSLVPPTITARPLPPRLAFRLQRQLRPAPHGRPITTRLEQLFHRGRSSGFQPFVPFLLLRQHIRASTAQIGTSV